MKKSLMNSTVLSTAFDSQASDPLKQALGKDNDLYAETEKSEAIPIPQSVEMMGALLSEILTKQYDVHEQRIFYYLQTFADDSFDIVFHPGYEDVKDGEPGNTENTQGDAFDDPDYYNAVNAMLNDIVDQADDNQVRIVPDTLSLTVRSKMGLFDAILSYLKEEGLNTPEMISFASPKHHKAFGPDDITVSKSQMVTELIYMNAALARKECAEDEHNADALFLAAEAKPYPSKVFYESSLLKSMNAEISISMDHLLKTIRQEDKIHANYTREECYRYGGMN